MPLEHTYGEGVVEPRTDMQIRYNGKIYEVVEERENEWIVLGKPTIWGATYSIEKQWAEPIEENKDYEPANFDNNIRIST